MKRSFKASKLSLTPELAQDALSRHAVATATRTCTQGLQQRRHAVTPARTRSQEPAGLSVCGSKGTTLAPAVLEVVLLFIG